LYSGLSIIGGDQTPRYAGFEIFGAAHSPSSSSFHPIGFLASGSSIVSGPSTQSLGFLEFGSGIFA